MLDPMKSKYICFMEKLFLLVFFFFFFLLNVSEDPVPISLARLRLLVWFKTELGDR